MLLRAGRGVKLVGTDLGPQLIKALKKLGEEDMTQEQVLNAIDQWEVERLRRSKSKGAVKDRAECLRVFATFGANLSAAVGYAEHLFNATGTISLLSGHKSKGLEFDAVIHLDPWRIPSPWSSSDEELRQEQNLDYVITTRAKRELIFADLERFVG